MGKRKGTKETLVLLPGYDGDGVHSFAKIKQVLEKDYTVLALNYPYIDSDKKAYTLDELAEYVFHETRQYGTAHLLGFSMGGFVAIRYAQLHPDRVQSLLLISSSPTLIDTPAIRILSWAGTRIVRNRTLANIFAWVYCAPLLRFLVKYSPLPVPKVSIPPRMGYPYFGTLGNVIESILSPSYREYLSHLPTPRRALLFRDDMSFPADRYHPFLSGYGFTVAVKENGGHATSRDYWDQVGAYLQHELRGLPQA